MGGQRWPKGQGRILSRIKVNGETGCWDWTGTATDGGYGRLPEEYAHRVSYRLFVGPIPEGWVVDHLCNRPCCVNPEHLEPVTQLENMRRYSARRTHCKQGHELTPENTYTRPRSRVASRDCRTCINAHARSYRERRSA